MNDLMISFVLFVFFVLFIAQAVFLYFQFIKQNNYLRKLKMKAAQNTIAMKLLHKKIALIEEKIEHQFTLLKSIKKSGTTAKPMQDSIEYDYERAKNLLKRGVPFNDDLLKRCNITEEEYQILSETLSLESAMEDD